MLEFFLEGGPLMWPVLAFGLVLVGASIHYAVRANAAHRRFLKALSILLFLATVHSMLLDVSKVLGFLVKVKPDEVVPFLSEGLKESTRPGLLGGTFLVLGWVLIAVGEYRAARRGTSAPK